jgi:protein RhuM
MEEVKFLLYSYLEDDVNIGVIVKNDTLWLTQKSMAELFGVGVPAISKHLKKSMNLRNLKKIRLFPK